MGTLIVPYNSIAKAKLFAKKMTNPWIAKVKLEKVSVVKKVIAKTRASGSKVYTMKPIPGKFKEVYNTDVKGLYNLFFDDYLLDELDAMGEKRKKDFDARPIIKKTTKIYIKSALKNIAKEEKVSKAFGVVAGAVGIKVPVSKIK